MISARNVTVAIPFCNESLEEFQLAVKSLYAQSVTDWAALILISDNARDELVEAARAIDDPRVKVIHDGRRRGLAARLNEVASMTRTTLLARMDADDIMLPHRFEKELPVLASGEVDLVSSRMACLTVDGAITGEYREVPMPSGSLGHLKSGSISHPTVIARTQWHRDNPYQAGLRAEDKELWLRTADFSTFEKVDEVLYLYRVPLGFNRDKAIGKAEGDFEVSWGHVQGLLPWHGQAKFWAVNHFKRALWRSPLGPTAWKVLHARHTTAPSKAEARDWAEAQAIVAATQVPGWTPVVSTAVPS